MDGSQSTRHSGYAQFTRNLDRRSKHGRLTSGHVAYARTRPTTSLTSVVRFLICGRDIAWAVRVCCVALVMSRPSRDQRSTAAASLSRAFQTGPLDPRSTVHRRRSRASACAVVPWPWAVRCKIDGPGSSTSIRIYGFPERVYLQTEKGNEL